jgi:hypothetical protein
MKPKLDLDLSQFSREIDADFYAASAATRKGKMSTIEFYTMCLLCARDYAVIEDYERVGHCLLQIPTSFWDKDVVEACIEIPELEEALITLAEEIAENYDKFNQTDNDFLVDLT